MLQALLLCLSLGFLCLQVVISEIQLGSRLVVGENSLWESKNGDFALGFFNYSDSPNRFSIGIRFNSKSIPPDQQTVVWVAGGAVTVTDNNSYFELTKTGELVLFDSSLGVPVWNSKTTSHFSASSALLRDDGNLVLLNEKDKIVWQSFDTPADTLLPGQKLSAYESLRAASENSRSSYYSLHMEEKLELRWESNITFWSSGNQIKNKKKKKNTIGAVLTSEGALFLEDQEDMRPIWSAFGEDHNDTVKFRFLRLDRDGNLRMYSWNDDSNWKPVWQAIENQCHVFATCGQQVCSFNTSGYPECSCPYTFGSVADPECLAPYQKVACKSGFAMEEFKHMHLYGIYPVNDSVVHQVSSQRCKKICLEDPACTAVTYTNDGNATCLVKLTRYISGFSEPSLSSISFVKRCSDPIAVDPSVAKSSPSSSETVTMSHSICLPCLVGATSTTAVLFLGFQIGILVCIYRRKKQVKKKAVELSKMANPKGLIIFSVDEIKAMTDNFKHNLGPKMFKGVLSENELVAVKEMEVTLIEERKFRSSASKIGTMHHKNLAKLEGYCCELGKRFLVHEYATNGSLLDHIADPLLSKKLTWRKRTETCLSVAKALCYLHTECREFVSHGNLNCGNILLGENSEAKLTEYGFSSCAANKDVEDFGKTMLTLITGICEPGVSEWVYREWIEGRKETVVDKRLEGGFDFEELERILRISFWCIQADERLRPSMGEVVKVLEGTLSVDPPPPPFSTARSSPANSSDSSQSKHEP